MELANRKKKLICFLPDYKIQKVVYCYKYTLSKINSTISGLKHVIILFHRISLKDK